MRKWNQVAMVCEMKRVKAQSDWFGESKVRLYGDDRDPIPCIGERVLLTGGVEVVVVHLGTVQTRCDSFRGARLWEVTAEVDKAPSAG
jgi:hypothetical protein